MWAAEWTREADQASRLPYQVRMPLPGSRRQHKPQEMRALIPYPPPGSKTESNHTEVEAERTEARHQEELSNAALGEERPCSSQLWGGGVSQLQAEG